MCLSLTPTTMLTSASCLMQSPTSLAARLPSRRTSRSQRQGSHAEDRASRLPRRLARRSILGIGRTKRVRSRDRLPDSFTSHAEPEYLRGSLGRVRDQSDRTTSIAPSLALFVLALIAWRGSEEQPHLDGMPQLAARALLVHVLRLSLDSLAI